MAAHAFSSPSVGLWVIEPANLASRLPRIAAFAGGLISDVFVPGSASLAQADAIRATVRPNGARLRAQLWAVARDTTPEVYAQQANLDSRRIKAGVTELNIEKPDDILADYIRRAVTEFRRLRPKYRVRVNIAPYKGFGLTGLAFSGTPYLYAIEQGYYGDMSPVAGNEALSDLLDYGVPRDRAQVMYGAAGPIGWSGPNAPWQNARHCTLGTLYTTPGTHVKQLASGSIFSDDLLIEAGLL